MIDIRVGNQPPSQFCDFLVGALQPPISVTIRTSPPGAGVAWTIRPLNAESGAVNPDTGSAKEFTFTPIVTTARAGLNSGSRKLNKAVGYLISVVMPVAGGRQETAIGEIEQDE